MLLKGTCRSSPCSCFSMPMEGWEMREGLRKRRGDGAGEYPVKPWNGRDLGSSPGFATYYIDDMDKLISPFPQLSSGND